jgi:hypothetical protein
MIDIEKYCEININGKILKKKCVAYPQDDFLFTEFAGNPKP